MCIPSVAAVLFTAIGISFVAIALHGSLRVPDDLFTDEIEVRHPTIEGNPDAVMSYHSTSTVFSDLGQPACAPQTRSGKQTMLA